MCNRVVFLLLVNLLFFFPSYIAASDLREVLQETVNNALSRYKVAHEKQSSVYPKCETFTDAYVKIRKVLRDNVGHVTELLQKLREAELKYEENSSAQNYPSHVESGTLSKGAVSKGETETPFTSLNDVLQLWVLLEETLSKKFPDFKPSSIQKKRMNFTTAKELITVFETNLRRLNESIHTVGLMAKIYSEDTYFKATRVLIALWEWKKKANCIDLNEFHKHEFIHEILESIHNTGKINFVQFVCPNVDFSLLSSSAPEKYYFTSVEESIFYRQKDSLFEFVKNLRLTGVPIKICLLIGDDEDSYWWPDEKSCTFPIFKKPPGLVEEKLVLRREAYRSNIEAYTRKYFDNPDNLSEYSAVDVEVHNLFDKKLKSPNLILNQATLSEVFTNCQKYFSEAEYELEKTRMEQLAKNYYRELFHYFARSLEESEEKTKQHYLPAIIRAKFATYALDGLTAYDCSPYAILLQTESPPVLRSKMINTGIMIRDNKIFSVVYLSNDKDSKRNTFLSGTSTKVQESKSKNTIL
ncbi:MAG: hypothetical protein BGO77_07955 [Caedibacter sp. 37-49]|nr:MAG: hypothetical protein BGO77_07955 [Caedibacter sp. 37-49]